MTAIAEQSLGNSYIVNYVNRIDPSGNLVVFVRSSAFGLCKAIGTQAARFAAVAGLRTILDPFSIPGNNSAVRFNCYYPSKKPLANEYAIINF